MILDVLPSINSGNIDEVYPLIYPYRAPKEDVYEQIYKDLDFALKNARDFDQDKNIITKGTVRTLLAKYYATLEDKDWNKINSLCDEILPSYPMVQNYADLFDDHHKTHQRQSWRFIMMVTNRTERKTGEDGFCRLGLEALQCALC